MASPTLTNYTERHPAVAENGGETYVDWRQHKLLAVAADLGERALNFLGEKFHYPERPAYDPDNVNNTDFQPQTTQLYLVKPTGAQFPEGWD